MNSSLSLFHEDFYGPTLFWFGPIFTICGVFSFFGNALLLWIGITTKAVRCLKGSLYIISLALSDFLFGFSTSALSLIGYLCEGRPSCTAVSKASGAITVIAILSALIFPSLVAMNRYLNITIGMSTESPIRSFVASKYGTALLTCATWLYVTTVVMVLIAYDAVGEDFFGFYAARRFQNFWLSLIYLTGALYAALAFTLSFFFYNRMHSYVQSNLMGDLDMSIRTCTVARSTSLHSIVAQQERRDTLAIMTMVKWTTLIPLVTQALGFFLDGGQWFLPIDLLPMWFRRLVFIPFALPPVFDPWVTLLTLGPFRYELKRRYAKYFCSSDESQQLMPNVVFAS